MSCANQRWVLASVFGFAVAVLGMATVPALAQTATAVAPVAVAPAAPTKPVSAATVVQPSSTNPMAAPMPALSTDASTTASDEDLTDEQIMAQMGAPVPPLGTPLPVPSAVPAAVKTNGIPSSVTDVVDDLRASEKNVSLEDMARARDALTRLDLLLEIEKRINDIEKARDDRRNIGRGSRSSMASLGGMSGIPASALGLPPLPTSAPGTASVRVTDGPSTSAPSMRATPAVASGGSGGYTIEQISALNGNYRAVVTGTGGRHTVEQGDKLGGYTVQKISATGVVLAQGKERKTLTVEADGTPVLIRAR
jgi:hypothetical protein